MTNSGSGVIKNSNTLTVTPFARLFAARGNEEQVLGLTFPVKFG